jgi:gas vesicle protein
MKTNGESNFASFIVGLALGAVAGLLLAPRPGEETWRYVRERSNKSLEYMNEQAAKLRKASEALVEAGKKLLACQRQSVKTDTEAEKQAYAEERREPLGG